MRNLRFFTHTLITATLAAAMMFPIKVAAQDKKVRQPSEKTSPRLDLIDNAATLALDVGREAAALSNPIERVERQLEAAQILALARPADALRLLDMAWLSLKEESEGEGLSAIQRDRALDLRSNLLSLYSGLAPERVKKLIASLPENVLKSAGGVQGAQNSSTLPTERQTADEIINISFPKIQQNPAETVEAAIMSLQKTGKISEYLSAVVETLYEKGNQPLLHLFEERMATILSVRSSFDPLDQKAVALLLYADPQMPAPAQSVFLGFLIRSLEKLVEVNREAQLIKQPPSVESDIVSFTHSIYRSNVRPLFVKYSPRQLKNFDLLLAEIAASLPSSYQDGIYDSSTTDAVEDQLARARKTEDKSLRESRLLSFTFRALAGRLPTTAERQLEFAAIAVDEIEDDEIKAVLRDFLLMAGARNSTAEKNFPVSVERALKVSRLDWRAWTLMAIATAQVEQNRGEALHLYDEALRVLEKSAPSPRKSEFAFLATELLSKHDLLRAFESLAAAVKYANQASGSDTASAALPSTVNRFFSHIGKLSMAPGSEPLSLDEIGFGEGVDEGIGRLADSDWMRADQIGKTIQNLGLRLRYQLAMCKGVLSKVKTETKVTGVD